MTDGIEDPRDWWRCPADVTRLGECRCQVMSLHRSNLLTTLVLLVAGTTFSTQFTACAGQQSGTTRNDSTQPVISESPSTPNPTAAPETTTPITEPVETTEPTLCCAPPPTPQTTATNPSTTGVPIVDRGDSFLVPIVRCGRLESAWDVPFKWCQKSPAIQLMQSRLNEVGSYGLVPDGEYGQATTNAVVDFQMRHRLAVSGICDWPTWAALFPSAGLEALDLDGDGILGPNELTGE